MPTCINLNLRKVQHKDTENAEKFLEIVKWGGKSE